MPVARIGISGWSYPAWRGDWYPTGLPHRSELEYSAGRLRTVELNGSFYSLQKPASYLGWYDTTPNDFVFAVKGGRFITHLKRLHDVEIPLDNFFASGVLALRDKLGPILWQLPERHAYDRPQLEAFLDLLPRTSGEALVLARKHDERLNDRCWLEEQPDRPIRYALEARHPGFESQEVPGLLRAHDVAFVVADTAGRWPQNREVTSDFVYVRLHGSSELYTSGYQTDEIATWAADTKRWLEDGKDVYIYFDNDARGRAPFDAAALAEFVESISAQRIRPTPPTRNS